MNKTKKISWLGKINNFINHIDYKKHAKILLMMSTFVVAVFLFFWAMTSLNVGKNL